MSRRVELYGRLRDAGLGSAVSLDPADCATAGRALAALRRAFGAKASLLQGCVLASEDDVLSASDRLPSRGRLAVLPPVCGG